MESVRLKELKALSDTYLESLLSDLPSEADIARQQVLSKRFLHKMSRLIRVKRSKPRAWKRTLLVAAIIGTIMAIAVSAYAYREAIASFLTYVYKEFTSIDFQQTPGTSESSDSNRSDWIPTDTPQGYKASEHLILEGLDQITYINEAGDILLIERVEKSGLRMDIDTEGVTFEELEIKGYRGIFYANKGQNNLIWEDEYYAYAITGIITKQEMINLANMTN